MKIDRPVIVFGTGRSGTTIFHQILSEYNSFGWLSKFCDKYPNKLYINRCLMKLLEYDMISQQLRKKYVPSECYAFWEYYCKGFSKPFRDLTGEDLTERSKTSILRALSQISTNKKNRILLKVTGWPRLEFFEEVFTNAKYIHITRDGRSVANSLLNTDFWLGWGGPNKWRWGDLSTDQLSEWKSYNKSFIVLAAIQWIVLMKAAEDAIKQIGEDKVVTIKYEELCIQPVETFRFVADFVEIRWTTRFERIVSKYKLKDTNDKWKNNLNVQQQRDLEKVISGYMNQNGLK